MKISKKILRCIIILIVIIWIALALWLNKKVNKHREKDEIDYTLKSGYFKTLIRTEECWLNWDTNIFEVQAWDNGFYKVETKRKWEWDITDKELDIALNCLTAQFPRNKAVNIADGWNLTDEQEKLIKDRWYYISYD